MMTLVLILLSSFWSSSFDKSDYENIQKHDFHTSLAEIEYNTSSKSFEVSLRLFIDDFEEALSKKHKLKNLSLDKTKKFNHLVENYIKDSFYLLDPKGQKLNMSFLGKELESDVIWVYFEIAFKKYKPGYKIRNSVLTELFDDQVNFVNIKYKDQKRSYLLKREKISAILNFD